MGISRRLGSEDSSDAVERWLAASNHSDLALIRSLRTLILGVDPAVREGVKWNAPSFRAGEAGEYFATVHWRLKQGVGLVLHRGAKKRPGPEPLVDDPAGQLEPLGPDRAMLRFEDAADLKRRAASLRTLLRAWIASLGEG